MMNNTLANKKIAVIGAGIAGLTVAQQLAQSHDVTVFDKSRGMGGRMATRRTDDYHFDHGAQFFTAKSDAFKALLTQAQNDHIIEPWHCHFAEIIGETINKKWQFDNHHPHFVAKPHMNNLCKYIAKDLNVILNTTIQSIAFEKGKWSLQTQQSGYAGDFDYLILAIPCHQAVDLLPKNFLYFDIVSDIKMSGCFALMLGFKEKLQLEFDAALVKKSNLSWISANNSKPGRPHNGTALLVKSSNQWADAHIEDDPESVKEKMIQSLQKIINFDVNTIDYQTLHRWKYANAKLREGEKSLFDPHLNLGICGDWLIAGRVEYAFLSAMNLYETMQRNNPTF